MPITFSFVIINYRTKELTEQCLDSIFSFCPNNKFEIILVDNNSNDGSIEFLSKKYLGKINLIASKKNLGFSGGNNLGAKSAKGDFLFFLNSDTIVDNDILAPIENIFKNNEKIGIVSPTLINSDRSIQKKACGKTPNLKWLILKNLKIIKETEDHNSPEWVSGAALVIRKNIFELISGWDENFFMYLEDTDLCKKTTTAGYKIKIIDTQLIHLGGQSPINNTKRRLVYFDSQDYFFKKHYGYLELALMKIIRWPYKFLATRKK